METDQASDIRHQASGPEDSETDVEPTSAGDEASESGGRTGTSVGAIGIAAIAVIVVLFAASQVFLITSLRSTQDQIESLDAQITDLNGDVFDISETVDGIARNATAASGASGGATPAPNLPAGFLPRFSEQGTDQALGMALSEITGPDAYTDEAVAVDPADGTRRVWMVWAHWCPYCQQELPALNAWWPEASGNYDTELVTVTSAMDSARGNPLDSYLEAEQFTFPVVVDSDTKLAGQMGVNAFPFWVVTDADGTVLFRHAGALGIEAVEQLFDQLEQIDA